MMKLAWSSAMRRRKRIRCYFCVLVIFMTLLGYYKCQRKMHEWPVLKETRPSWSTTQVTDSVIHRSTDVGVHNTQQTVNVATVNQIKDTTVYEPTDKENLSTSLLQYISNVSSCRIATIQVFSVSLVFLLKMLIVLCAMWFAVIHHPKNS